MTAIVLSDKEFLQFKSWIYQKAGISLSAEKKALVAGRLAKRIGHYKLTSYGQYLQLLESKQHSEEIQMAVDLLTTNETYFFREPKHFHFLVNNVLNDHPIGRPLRIWSAASSYGQEAYSIAMLLADKLEGQPWEILASDISQRVLEQARLGHYALEQSKHIPKDYLSKFCLKGIGPQEGTFRIDPSIRSKVSFITLNLTHSMPNIGEFDVIFLRNVMIYFDNKTKTQVIAQISRHLKPGGYLFIGHSESLTGIPNQLETIAPSIYRAP